MTDRFGRLLTIVRRKVCEGPVKTSEALKSSYKEADRIKTSQIHLHQGRATNVAPEQVLFHPQGASTIECIKITPTFDWACDPFRDINWCAQLHMWRMLDAHLLKYEASQDPCWLTRPIDIIQDYYDFHEVRGLSSPYSWSDHMVGQRAMRLAYIIVALRAHSEQHAAPHSVAVLTTLAQRHCEFSARSQ
jgi:hypothetical protein